MSTASAGKMMQRTEGDFPGEHPEEKMQWEQTGKNTVPGRRI